MKKFSQQLQKKKFLICKMVEVKKISDVEWEILIIPDKHKVFKLLFL